MREYSDGSVLEEACGAMWNVVGGDSEAVRSAALAAGAAEALRAVMGAHGEGTSVGRFARGALRCLV